MKALRAVISAVALGGGILAGVASTTYEEEVLDCTSTWTCAVVTVEMDCVGAQGEQECTCSNDSTCDQRSYCNNLLEWNEQGSEDAAAAEVSVALVDDVETCCGVDLDGQCDLSGEVKRRDRSGASSSVSSGVR